MRQYLVCAASSVSTNARSARHTSDHRSPRSTSNDHHGLDKARRYSPKTQTWVRGIRNCCDVGDVIFRLRAGDYIGWISQGTLIAAFSVAAWATMGSREAWVVSVDYGSKLLKKTNTNEKASRSFEKSRFTSRQCSLSQMTSRCVLHHLNMVGQAPCVLRCIWSPMSCPMRSRRIRVRSAGIVCVLQQA